MGPRAGGVKWAVAVGADSVRRGLMRLARLVGSRAAIVCSCIVAALGSGTEKSSGSTHGSRVCARSITSADEDVARASSVVRLNLDGTSRPAMIVESVAKRTWRPRGAKKLALARDK